MQTVRSCIGVDVHKAAISISVAEDGRSRSMRFLGVIPNPADDVGKMAKRLAKPSKARPPCSGGPAR